MKIKLRQAFDLQMGKTPARNRPDYWNGDHKWISIADIGNAGKFLTKTKESITEAGIDGSGIKVVPQGTVIMSFKLSIGKTAITSEDMYTNEAIMAFIDNGKFAIDTDYLYHLCCGTNWTAGTNKAVMGLTLNKATLLEKEIPLPDINEQHEIATKLDKIDAIIAERQQQLELIDQAVKSRFIELFGDPIKNTQHRPTTAFVNVVTMQRGFDLPVQDREQSGNIPVYGSNGVLDHHNQAKVCNGGVITGRSGTIGKVFYTKGAYWPLNTTLFSVDTHENNIIYLAHLLKMFNLARFTEGTGVPTLNRNKFHSAPIIDVPIDEQNQFAAFVEQTDKSKYYSSLSFRYCQAAANTYRQEWMTCRTSDF